MKDISAAKPKLDLPPSRISVCSTVPDNHAKVQDSSSSICRNLADKTQN